MSEQAEIDVVCFDLGRVLVRTCRSWAECFEKAGLDVPMVLRGEKRGAVQAAIDPLIEKNERGEIDQETYYAGVAEHLGITRGDMDLVNRSFLQGKFEGANELLAELAGVDGVALACLSNTNIFHWEMVHDAGGLCGLRMDCFRHKFASHELGVRKPRDEAYRKSQRQMGGCAGRVLFFDDVQENVEAAIRCGWRAERIMSRDNPVAEIRSVLSGYGIL